MNKKMWDNSIENQEELDLKPLFNIALRNKNFITTFSILTTTFCAISSFFITPVYRGSFEINTSKKDSQDNSGGMQSKDASLFRVISVATDSTQLHVLNSPLLLKPVYSYLKEENILEKTNNNFILYKDWRSKLKIDFRLKSKVLSVINRDTDKERILLTLNAIKKEYEKFSKRDQLKQLNNGIRYLEKQEKILLEKARKSRLALNEFSIKSGLQRPEGMVGLGNPKFDPLTLEINPMLRRSLTNSSDSVPNMVNKQSYGSQTKLLEEYEATYIDLSSKLKPNSKTLKNLKEKILNLKENLKRPNKTLLKYRELSSIAQRDESLANQISNTLQVQYLEKAKQLDPWETTTKPEVTNKIWPNKKLITIVAFLASIIISYLIALYRENKNGTIFELKDLLKIINLEFFGVFSSADYQLFSQVIISKTDLEDNLTTNNIGIIVINKEFLEKGNRVQNDFVFNSKLKETTFFNSQEISKFKKLVLIVEEGQFNKEFELTLNNFLTIYKDRLMGWFYII